MAEYGVVKWSNETKGYGFIARDTGDDVFVHQSNVAIVPPVLREGERVSFDVEQGAKGLQARNVVRNTQEG